MIFQEGRVFFESMAEAAKAGKKALGHFLPGRQPASREFFKVDAMPEFVPSGYLSIREALEGCELFPSAWTGEEHKARRGFIESIIQEILGPLTPRGRPSQ